MLGSARYMNFPCPSLSTPEIYEACTRPDSSTRVAVGVLAPGPEGSSALLVLTFGASLWLTSILHVFGTELYLWLTPAETQRLEEYSYKRQVEARFKHLGGAGLTADRLGDAPAWKSAEGDVVEKKKTADSQSK